MSKKVNEIVESKYNVADLNRREFIVGSLKYTGAILLGSLLPSEANSSMNISSDYSSRNKKRKSRSKTEYIVLHTTEAPDESSLNMVKRYGLANYLVQSDGKVKRIIDKNKVARHAGRSMWEGRRGLDNCSIGIEVVGQHNKLPTKKQLNSLEGLLDELQGIYDIPDEDVIPHSMVAYGKPNRWHPYNHRGRKRCGMLFANYDVRKKIGLENTPSYDPDVKAGRLRVADNYLNDMLFNKKITQEAVELAKVGDLVTKAISAWSIARDKYNAPTTRYTFPDGEVNFGDKIKNWDKLPIGTKIAINIGKSVPDDIEYFQKIVGNDTAWKVAGKEFDDATTIYFLPDGRVRRGDELGRKFLDHLPRETEVLTGYTYGGKVAPRRSAMKIAGRKWDDPSTFYRLPNGKIVSGEDMDSKNIPKKTTVFFRNGN